MVSQAVELLQSILDPAQNLSLHIFQTGAAGDRQLVAGGVYDAARVEGLIADAIERTAVDGVDAFVVLNPVKADRFSGSRNQVLDGFPGVTPDDLDVRYVFPIPVAPVVEPGLAPTEAELASAEAVIDRIQEYLDGRGWPEPVRVRTGREVVLLYKVGQSFFDWDTVRHAIEALASEFDTAAAKVVKEAYKATWLLRCPGTWCRLGRGTPGRPHRPCTGVPGAVNDESVVEPQQVSVVEEILKFTPGPSDEFVSDGQGDQTGSEPTTPVPADPLASLPAATPDTPPPANDGAPTFLSEYVAQAVAVALLKVALAAARVDDKPLPHGLLVGGAGLGKTLFARVAAREMGTTFHELHGSAIRDIDDLAARLAKVGRRDVVFIDEAQDLAADLQVALYPVLTDRKLHRGADVAPLSVADCTVLAGTTDPQRLKKPFRTRLSMVYRFGRYQPEELVTLLARRAGAVGWAVEATALPRIAGAGRRVARRALDFLGLCHQVCRSAAAEVITNEHVEAALRLEGRDVYGLDPTEQSYLTYLRKGPRRLNMIAMHLGRADRDVSQVLEPELMGMELVDKDGSGRRYLTEAGWRAIGGAGSASEPPGVLPSPLEETKQAVLAYLRTRPDGETKTVIRGQVPHRDRIDDALGALLEERLIVKSKRKKAFGGGSKPQTIYRLAEPAQRETATDPDAPSSAPPPSRRRTRGPQESKAIDRERAARAAGRRPPEAARHAPVPAEDDAGGQDSRRPPGAGQHAPLPLEEEAGPETEAVPKKVSPDLDAIDAPDEELNDIEDEEDYDDDDFVDDDDDDDEDEDD